MTTSPIPHSPLGYGCMHLGGTWDASPLTAGDRERAARLIGAALDAGLDFFDHADIYTRGKSEAVFGEVLAAQPGLRQKIVLQSKCGIRFADEAGPGRYDFSAAHIRASVEGSLRRLQTDYLDVLLLHRPDPLGQPEDVAQAFDDLHQRGLVRFFGVSNHTAGQIRLLRRFVRQPLIANQVQLSLLHNELIEAGVVFNQPANSVASAGAAGTLDYCRLHHIEVQAWAPLAGGQLINPAPGAAPRVLAAAAEVARLAARHGVPPEAVAVAWLLRHPAGIVPLVGTTRPDRLAAAAQAARVSLSREEWYALFVAARGAPMP